MACVCYLSISSKILSLILSWESLAYSSFDADYAALSTLSVRLPAYLPAPDHQKAYVPA